MILTLLKILLGLLTIGLSVWALYTDKPKHRRISIILIIIIGIGTVAIQVWDDVLYGRNEKNKINLIQQNLNSSDSIYNKLNNLYQEQIAATEDLIFLKETHLQTYYSLDQAKFSVHLLYEFTSEVKVLFEEYVKPTKYSEDSIIFLFRKKLNKNLGDIISNEFFHFKFKPIGYKGDEDGIYYSSNPGPMKKYFSFGNNGLVVTILNENFHISNDMKDYFKTFEDIQNTIVSLGINYQIKDKKVFNNVKIIGDVGIYFGDKKVPALIIPFFFFKKAEPDRTSPWRQVRTYENYELHMNDSIKEVILNNQFWAHGQNNFYYYYENLKDKKSILNY